MIARVNRYTYYKGGRKTVPYYSCGANHNKGRIACHANCVQASKIESLVLKKVSDYLQRDGLANVLHTYKVGNILDEANIPGQVQLLRNDIAEV